MKINNQNNLSNEFVKLKNNSLLDKYRFSGKVLANIMLQLKNLVNEKTNLSLKEIDKFAENEIRKEKCIPTFLNYKGFPASVCMSVNNQLVHGIPTDYKLQEGDLITFDFGVTFEGAITDAATTLIYGEAKSKEHIKLIEATKQALQNAIDVIQVGKRIGVIGNAIYKTGKNNGFSVVENYGGHGIEMDTPHSQPFISNKSNADEGIRFQEGMIIAIEPLFVIGGSNKTRVLDDKWTVVCENICAHEEHSLLIHKDKIEILTI